MWTITSMAARGEDGTAIEPLLAAVDRSGAALVGRLTVDQVLAHAEEHVAAILRSAEDHVRAMEREAESRSAELTSESRRRIAIAIATMVERASTLACNFESLLGLLDDADRALFGGT